MTWQGCLSIAIASVFTVMVSVWLDDHFFKDIKTCEKCGHVQGEDKK